MSDPKHAHQESQELDLDAQTVKDLELSQEAAENVEGGWIRPPITWGCPDPR